MAGRAQFGDKWGKRNHTGCLRDGNRYWLGAVALAGAMLPAAPGMPAGEAAARADGGLNRRGWTELMVALRRED
jgi:hypothetical protein